MRAMSFTTGFVWVQKFSILAAESKSKPKPYLLKLMSSSFKASVDCVPPVTS